MFDLELEKEKNQWELKKKNSYLQNTFFFPYIWTHPIFKAHNFLISSSF
jgi:hypothetical protein